MGLRLAVERWSASRAGEPSWAPNFASLVVCQFFSSMTFVSAFLFLPLYLRELGESEEGAIAWTGLVIAAGPAVQLVAGPFWGAVADRVGRKPMIVRAILGGAAIVGMMGLATQAVHLLVLRILWGAVAGANGPVIALAAVVLPPARLGVGMGLVQTAQSLGSSLGPLVGGFAAAAFGFRGAFAATAVSALATAGLVAAVVHEPPRRAAQHAPSIGLAKRLALVAHVPHLRAPVLAALGFQTAYMLSWVMLPLHVAQLAGSDVGAGAALTGGVLGANALGGAVGAATLGWLGSRVGVERIALVSLGTTAALAAAQTWARSPTDLVVLRLAIGVCSGGVLPSLRAVLGKAIGPNQAANASLGAIYGLAESATAAGLVLGPPAASLVASTWGIPSTHLASALLLGLTTGSYWWMSHTSGGLPRAGVRRDSWPPD